MSSEDEPEVLVERRGGLGVLTLNRPKAINALTLAMVDMMLETLQAWADDDSIETVLLRGAGERGLCAGGDIRVLYDAATSGDYALAETFWRREYALDALVARYPKPYVAVMDGLVQGGGVGISAHASHRVVTERSKVGMPEVTIGYTPDVGSSLILSRAPGELGTYAALTGATLSAEDADRIGFADTQVPSDRLEELAERLTEVPVDTALAEVEASRPLSEARLDAETIARTFAYDTMEDIVGALEEADDRATLDRLARPAPYSLKLTLKALRGARAFDDVAQALDQDLRLSLALVRRQDFREGVRAAVVDKDRDPKWQPDTLAAVDDAEVDAAFAYPARL